MRIMAIDYGDARIGLAVSDLTGILCGEAWTMEEWNMERASKRIAEEAAKRDVGTLVLGLPKNMDGTEGPRAEKSRAFAELLRADSGLEVVLWDERRPDGRRRGGQPDPGGLSRQPPLKRRRCSWKTPPPRRSENAKAFLRGT